MKIPKISTDKFESFNQNSGGDELSISLSLTVLVVSILLGVAGGLFLSKAMPRDMVVDKESTTSAPQEAKKVVGAVKKNFKDKVEGILREGGVDGEGNYFMERPGGPKQNAYVTSSTVDLAEFVGKKVRVWGETYQGEKVGWLMDVGLVEVLE